MSSTYIVQNDVFKNYTQSTVHIYISNTIKIQGNIHPRNTDYSLHNESMLTSLIRGCLIDLS